MLETTILTCALYVTAAIAQEAKPASDDVAGTWVMLLEGHQVGLGLEQDGTRLTGTLVIRGRNVAVEGELVNRKLRLTGEAAVGAHGDQRTVPLELTATLKDDGTMEGEMNTARGPTRWTAERLKPPGHR